LPCEHGSGSGNDTTGSSTAGGGIIGNTYIHNWPIFCLGSAVGLNNLPLTFSVTAFQCWVRGSILCQASRSMVH
jgi:hypothetical protein